MIGACQTKKVKKEKEVTINSREKYSKRKDI